MEHYMYITQNCRNAGIFQIDGAKFPVQRQFWRILIFKSVEAESEDSLHWSPRSPDLTLLQFYVQKWIIQWGTPIDAMDQLNFSRLNEERSGIM
jgi:hypothetical protein